MEQITASDLQAWLGDKSRKPPVLLDVREPWEFQICNLPGSVHIPMATIPLRKSELDPDADTVVICHHGARSFQVALFLERHGFGRLYNLFGGIDAWARQVDPSTPTY
jgi:rhodanese-related sulfurtransferase